MKILYPVRWIFGSRKRWLPLLLLALIASAGAAAWYFPQPRTWFNTAKHWAEGLRGGEHAEHANGHAEHAGHDEHDGHNDADGDADHDHDADGDADHDHDADHHDEKADAHGHADGGAPHFDHKHDEAAAIKLSRQARGNIDLRLAKVELRPNFERSITVPGMIVERPGWSVLEVTAPMTGVVTRIYPIQGEAIQPGQPLFEVRLTHEDLLQVQTEFLRTVEELDVIGREVGRLEKVSADGVVAGKTLLERKYEQQKQEAHLRAQRQALLLHGLSLEQVDKIATTRTLLQSLTVRAPLRDAQDASAAAVNCLQVQRLKVDQGKHVNAGDTLCTLVDHSHLYIEGKAFEQDIQAVNHVAAAGSDVSVILGSKSTNDEEVVRGLRILYLDDKVDRESRAFSFYVTLPNRLLRQDRAGDGRNFAYWQYKPGQRTQVRIPVEKWEKRIVLPVEALAQDGAEFYVFESNGDHLDRRPVRVEYRDQESAVIANDGSLKLGSTVAISAAHQMQLALKNKAGGGVDPHAGHNH